MSAVIETDVSPKVDVEVNSWKPLAFVLGAMAIGYAPLLWEHFRTMWERPQYQYFPFVLAAFGYLLWQRYEQSDPRDNSPRRLGPVRVTLLVGSWVALVVGVYLYDPWLAIASAVVVVGVLLSLVFASRRISNLWGVWCLLWLVVPPPLGLDQRLVVNLQSASSWLSSQAMDLLKIDHLMAGNVLQLPDKQFFVDEACSGIVSIMSVIACGAIYCVWRNRPLLHSIMLLIAGVLAAVALNAARITIIAAAFHYVNWNLSEGTPHEMLGLVLFLLTFAALIGSDYFLCWFLQPIPRNLLSSPGDEERVNPLGRAWNAWTLFGTPTATLGGAAAKTDTPAKPKKKPLRYVLPSYLRVAAVAFSILGVAHLVAWGGSSKRQGHAIEISKAIQDESFPASLGAWKRVEFEEVEREENTGYGQFSKIFRYRHDRLGIVAQASIDYPFVGSWHELSYCYELSGWRKHQRQVVGEDGFDWKYIAADYDRDQVRFGNLLYSVMDDSTAPVSPPDGGLKERIWRRMRRRGPRNAWPTMLQVQVWHEQPQEVDEATHDALLELFLGFRNSHQAFVANHVH